MVNVDINPELLHWAIYRSGKEEDIEIRFPKLDKWLTQESQPTFNELERFANYTLTPLGCFFLSAPPTEELPIPHYRTLDNSSNLHPSPNLLETVHTMERRQEWLRHYLMEHYDEPLNYVGSVNTSDDYRIVAKRMRDKLGLTNGWASKCKTWEEALRFLMRSIEEIGIIVVVNGIVGNNTHRKLDVNEFRGFVLVDPYAPLIFVNGADGKAAQMFTLAHELAHIWYGLSAAFDLETMQPSDNDVEVACNKVAAEFLIPEDEFKSIWPTVADSPDAFQTIARRFKVSEMVVARRALDLNIISKPEFFDFYSARQALELTRNQGATGGDFYRTAASRISPRFAEKVITATKEGSLLYRDAYKLTGLNDRTFNEFAKRLSSWRDL